MKELLLGWIVKPKYLITQVDNIIGTCEIIIVCLAIWGLYKLVNFIKNKKRRDE